MVKIMERAIEKLRSLADDRQETFARFLLSELDADAAWERTTTANAQSVDRLVQDVLAADARGETEVLNPDQL